MIVLDTNVVSELARPRPDPAVLRWVDACDAAELVLTAITTAEIRAEIALLPQGRRRDEIGARMELLITDTFAGFVLPFDVESSTHYAQVVAERLGAGRPIGLADAQIAAVVRQHRGVLATRNTADFVETGIAIINPWVQ